MTAIDAAPPADDGSESGSDRLETIPLGERWFKDAFGVMPAPGGFALRLVDMTQAKAALGFLRAAGFQATFTHLIVRAAAVALARNPDLHQMVCQYRRLTPGAVDIGLSMAGQTTYAPVVLIPSAERKTLASMVPTVNDAIRAAREKEQRDLEEIRKRGWMVPFGFMRRFLLRWFQRTFWFRRRLVGTFQVSCLASVDMVASFLFYTGSILGAGGIRDRVLAQGGQAVVRPTVWLTICVDHAAMDGQRAGRLLKAIKSVLEGEELVREARDAASARGERPLDPATPRPAGGGATATEAA
jgi:2-oxoacid dehydrogenases acyltransferase (catalytic domain)